jgi:hypothetical protein
MTSRHLALWLALALVPSTTGCDAVGGLLGTDGSKSSRSSGDESEADEASDDEAKPKKKSKKAKPEGSSEADAKPASKDAKDFPAPDSFASPPLVAGAFSRLRVTKNGQPDGEQLIEILEVTGDVVRAEVEAKGPTIVQFKVRVRDRTKPSGLDILEAKLKSATAPVITLSGAQLGMAQSMLHGQLDVFRFPDASAQKQRGDVTVPAGTFRGALIDDRQGEVPMLKLSMKSRTWYHPAVPTNGAVRIESEVGPDKYLYELLEFGTTGAKASL